MMPLFKRRRIVYAALAIGVFIATTMVSLYIGFVRFDPYAIAASCEGVGNKPLCYTDQINDVMAKRGLSAAFDVVALVYESDPDFAGTCHSSTHEIGKEAYRQFHETGEVELSSNTWYCGYGFYHGFMEGLFVDTNDLDVAREFCSYVGENVPHPPPPKFAEGSCYHGIGHGVTDGSDPRLWGDELRLVEPGLALCAKVAAGNLEWQSRCASGVFNSLANMYFDPASTARVKPGKNPYTFCKESPFHEVDRESCYNQMNTVAATLAEGDLQKMLSYTTIVPTGPFRLSAVNGATSFYIQHLRFSKRYITPEISNICASEKTADLRRACITGIVAGIFEFGSPGMQYKEASGLCGAPALDESLRETCYYGVLENAGFYYDKSQLRDACEIIPGQYHSAICE